MTSTRPARIKRGVWASVGFISHGMCTSTWWYRSWPTSIIQVMSANDRKHHQRYAHIWRVLCALIRYVTQRHVPSVKAYMHLISHVSIDLEKFRSSIQHQLIFTCLWNEMFTLTNIMCHRPGDNGRGIRVSVMAYAPYSVDVDRRLLGLRTILSHLRTWPTNIAQTTFEIACPNPPWPTIIVNAVEHGLPELTLAFKQRKTKIRDDLHTSICRHQTLDALIIFSIH